MISNNQLRGIQIRSKIVSDLASDTALNIEDIKELFMLENVLAESSQIDELFKLLVDTVKGSSNQMPKSTNIKEIFKQLCPADNDYSDFLANFFDFTINDSPDEEISVRFNKLKNLKYDKVPEGSEVYNLYLYNVLSLALVCHPLDIAFINEKNNELMNSLKDKN